MSSRTPTRKNTAGTLSKKKMSELWAALDPVKLKEYLSKHDTYKANANWSLKGSVLTGRCRAPEHAGKDVNPSLGIFPKKGFSKCFTCGHYETNIGKILAPIVNQDPKAVLKDLQSHFNVKIYKTNDIKDSEIYTKHVNMKNLLAKVFNQELCEAIDLYRAGTLKDSSLYYAENMIVYLEKRDKQILDYVANLPLGIFVDAQRLNTTARNMGINGSIVEAMKEYLGKNMVEYYLGSLVLIYHENMKDVSRFRLRLPDSINENGVAEKVIRAIADPHTPELGIFGLGYNAGVLDVHDRSPKALLCEGEFDTIAIMINQMVLNDPSWLPLCHSGNTSAGDLSALEHTPISTVYYVPDHDTGGINNTKLVLSNNHSLDIKIFNWPIGITVPSAPSTDVSDSIQTYGFEKVNNEFREVEKNYAKREAWARNRVNEECRDLDPDDSADFATIKEVAQEYAGCIGDINDTNTHDTVKKWLNDVLTAIGVSSAEITSITVSASSEDDPEQEFVTLVALTIENQFYFVAYDPQDRKITLWDKKKRNISYLRTASEAGMKSDIGNTLGDIRQWIVGEVPGGLPAFIKFSDSDEKQARNYLQIDTLAGEYIRMAIRHKIPDLKAMDTFERYADGVHWLKTSGGDRLFIVNGNHVYMGYFSEEGLFWEELTVPIYEGYYFDLSKNAWSDNIKSVQDLRNAPDVELSTILEKNTSILDAGWTFLNQKSEASILGAWATVSTIVKIFGSNLQFLASNERSCGKSALYAELFGGGKGTNINITEHTQYVDNITPAGMRQAMDGSSRVLIIDEFDNQKGSRGTQEKQEEVLLMLRTASSGDGIFMQGTTSGKPRIYRFSVSTMMAGIDPEMTEANQTRLITTDLKSGLDGRLPPQATILEKYTQEELRELRMWNTLSTFKHVPKILSAYHEVEKAILDDSDIFGEGVMQRFKESLAKIISVYKAAYPDKNTWIEMGKEICNAKKLKLATLKNATANSDLIESLLFTNGVEVVSAVDKKVYNIVQLLTSSEIIGDQTSINNSNTGVWLQPTLVLNDKGENSKKYYLFIQWKNISSTLFKYNQRWKQSPAQLKTIASRHPKVLKEPEAKALYLKEKAIPAWIGGANESSYSVLDVTDYVVESNEREQAFHAYSQSPEFNNSLPGADISDDESGFSNV